MNDTFSCRGSYKASMRENYQNIHENITYGQSKILVMLCLQLLSSFQAVMLFLSSEAISMSFTNIQLLPIHALLIVCNKKTIEQNSSFMPASIIHTDDPKGQQSSYSRRCKMHYLSTLPSYKFIDTYLPLPSDDWVFLYHIINCHCFLHRDAIASRILSLSVFL